MAEKHSHLQSLAKTISTSSAMNPGLVLCLILCPLCLSLSGALFAMAQPFPASLFFAAAMMPAGIVGWQLIRFTVRDPDRLQREQHVERMTEIRGQLTVKQDDTIQVVPISNRLTSNKEAEESAQ